MSSRKTMKKDSRLQSAMHWIPTYTGKNIVQGYRKKYGVSLICAANELKLLGIEISDTYISQLKQAEENTRKLKEQKATSKKLKKLEEQFHDSNKTFYYIAGYTSGGAPYGITWEEMGLEPYGVE
ncbi:hypothetical protein EHE19_017125 [Ruminiclostridium herbifermentans]|uniref:Uncharacterized protein n=1 Tax=Ruminiclostridium herbifermentans TaxID=2488810 RepID=A0A4U7J853_9FIRM|nr:hypothetical protein [Ruminiclostridium herbifermentans]QNU68958.1 hypothetical protein EHE19_017125 [Ruminiclostridium herbifermentans]